MILAAMLVIAVGCDGVARSPGAAGEAVPPPEAMPVADPARAAAVATTGIGEARIAAALGEALSIATSQVVTALGLPGGFADDPAIRIPLPGGLAQVRRGLVGAGLGPLVVDLETRMNRAAEAAMPQAGQVLGEALAAMTIADARDILAGPDDAATRYFEAAMRPELAERLTPIVEAELREAGAVTAFDAFVAGYAALPLMPDIRGSLTRHVVDAALAGLFHYLAVEESRIRRDPVARTTDLLRQVFGG